MHGTRVDMKSTMNRKDDRVEHYDCSLYRLKNCQKVQTKITNCRNNSGKTTNRSNTL